MPLPLAHSAAAATIYLACSPAFTRLEPGRKLLFFLALVFMANAADLDFLPGILIDDPHRFHHGPSHSLAVSLLLGAAGYLALRRSLRDTAMPWQVAAGALLLAALSHPLLDLFSVDRSEPFGLPLLWPASGEYMISPYPLFTDIVRDGSSTDAFFSSLLSAHNIRALLTEIAFTGMLLLATLAIQRHMAARRYWPALGAALLFGLIFLFNSPIAVSYSYISRGEPGAGLTALIPEP